MQTVRIKQNQVPVKREESLSSGDGDYTHFLIFANISLHNSVDFQSCRAIIALVKKNIFLVITFLGLLFPYYFICKFYTSEHIPVVQAVTQLFTTDISAAFNADLLVAVLASWAFMIFEGRRINMKNWWLFLPATLIGLSFALPLFLYFREKQLEDKK